MKPEQLREELESLSDKLGITVRYEQGDFKGGICQVKEETLLIVPKRLPLEKQVQLLSRELAQFPLENIYILPAIRKLLDEYKPPSESESDNEHTIKIDDENHNPENHSS